LLFFGERRRKKSKFDFFDAFSVCFDDDADGCSVECFESERFEGNLTAKICE